MALLTCPQAAASSTSPGSSLSSLLADECAGPGSGSGALPNTAKSGPSGLPLDF